MAKPGVKLEFDLRDGYAALGYVKGMVAEINTDRYIGPVISYTHAKLANVFDEHMDVISVTNASAYSHVYEWRRLGMPNGHLWSHKISGGGTTAAGRVREATFEWKPSVRPILTPEERMADDNDPISKVDPQIIAKLKKRSYIFKSKAPIMEYGLRAVVRPTNAKWLFVPTESRLNGPEKFKGFYLAKQTVQNFAYRNPQDSSGGAGSQGRFTAAWVEWWNTEAPALWDSEISKTIEQGLGRSETELNRVSHSHARTKVMGIGVFNSEAKAFESGQKLAKAYIYRNAQSYAAAARDMWKNGVMYE
jgi:hypothetical protein